MIVPVFHTWDISSIELYNGALNLLILQCSQCLAFKIILSSPRMTSLAFLVIIMCCAHRGNNSLLSMPWGEERGKSFNPLTLTKTWSTELDKHEWPCCSKGRISSFIEEGLKITLKKKGQHFMKNWLCSSNKLEFVCTQTGHAGIRVERMQENVTKSTTPF